LFSDFSGGCRVDLLEVTGLGLPVLPGHVTQRVPDHVHDAQLDLGLGEHAGNRIGEAGQAGDRGDQDVLQASVVQLGQHVQAELGAFVLPDPKPQKILVSGHVDAKGHINCPVLDAAISADLQVDGVQVNNGVNGVQRPDLPCLDLVRDRVSHPGDQCRRHLHLVDLFEVILKLTGRHTPGVQGQNLLIEDLQPHLAFAHQLRIKVAGAIPRNFDIQITVGAVDPLAGLAVARVAGAAPIWGVLLIG